jgi:dihydrofolate synthase / folylpolyglutamate synthase
VPPADPPVTLEDWLAFMERAHPRAIELGLARVATVRDALGLTLGCPVITVGGTNGKGSACAMLEAILARAGYRIGCYSSPHLLRYNERVRIERREATDPMLVSAFEAVERARGATPLTYFEFGTLAAVWLFARSQIDAAILEVGLGGRLDAVNAFDPDCALVMSVDLDHMDYLGETREQIGLEKAGIFRAGRPAICADPDPPRSLLAHARRVGAELLLIGGEFGFEAGALQWRYWGPRGARHGLPYPVLRGHCQLANAAACLAALDTLRERLPVSAADVRSGLLEAEIPGRFQVLPGRPQVILDVAHNPAAARALAQNLRSMEAARRTYAVFAMLRDKDIAEVARVLAPQVDEWLVAGLEGMRGSTAEHVREELARAGVIENVLVYDNVADAYEHACRRAAEADRILAFGSFHTVAAVMSARARRRG